MSLYTRLIARGVKKRGWKLQLLTTKSTINDPSFKLVHDEVDGQIQVCLMPEINRLTKTNSMALLYNQFLYFLAIYNGFRLISYNERPDIIYVVNLDECDKIISLVGSPFGRCPFSGMMMSIKFHRFQMGISYKGRSDSLLEWSFRRLLKLKSLYKVAIIDESFIYSSYYDKYIELDKIKFVPDAGYLHGNVSKKQARKSLGITGESFVVLVYGTLVDRKGIRQLINALIQSKQNNICILLAGTPNQSITNFINEKISQDLIQNNKLILNFGYHDDVEECRVFCASDLVWVGYVDGFSDSSGVLYQAGSVALPVIATYYGLIGWLVNKYKIGLCCNPHDSFNVMTSILLLMNDKALYSEYSNNAIQLSSSHTGSMFSDSILSLCMNK